MAVLLTRIDGEQSDDYSGRQVRDRAYTYLENRRKRNTRHGPVLAPGGNFIWLKVILKPIGGILFC